MKCQKVSFMQYQLWLDLYIGSCFSDITSDLCKDFEYVNPPPDAMKCPICRSVFWEPHSSSCCKKNFCETCIQHYSGKPCPSCKKKSFTTKFCSVISFKVNSLIVYCPHKHEGCDWKGQRGKIQDHLNPDPDNESPSHGCGYVMVSCSHQCGTQMLRHQIQEHETKSCPKRPMELQVTSMFDILRQELNETKQAYQKELENLKQAHECELAEIKHELDELKKQVDSRFASHIIDGPVSVPPFYCTMYNVQDHIRTNNRWCSPTFYSHNGGYKMRFDVFIKQDAVCAPFVMKYMVFILRGEFDSQLNWPFDGEVNIEISNHVQKRWDPACTVVLNERESGLKSVRKRVDILTDQGQSCEVRLDHSKLSLYARANSDICWFRVVSVHVRC